MAKVAVPPSKPPVDKGQHFLLTFPLANIKEPVKVDLLEEDDVGSCKVRVCFETFSPNKKYEKVIDLPEPVCLRQMSKNINQKNLSVILLKVAGAPPASPKSSPSQAPVASAPVPAPVRENEPDVKENGASRHPTGDSETLADDLDVEADESSDKRKKKKPKKKGRNSNSKINEEDNEEIVDNDAQNARIEIERLQAEILSARSNAQTKKDLEAAEARESQALKKITHFENELKRWQAERAAAVAQCKECRTRLSESQQIVKKLEGEIEKQRSLVKECEARAIARQREAAEKERERLEKEELLTQEEKRKEQEERRKRLEEERQRAADEKKKKEAERKENARKREEERKMKEAEEERLKTERKRKTAEPTKASKSIPNDGYNVLVSESQKAIIKKITEMFPKDPAAASKMLEEAGKAEGGIAFYICLSQLHEDHGNDAECGEALLKMLAHPSAKTAIPEKERSTFAMKAMAKLKEHPKKLHECRALLDKLTPDYGILGMSHFSSEDMLRSGRSKAPEKSEEKPWTGPLIEEIPMDSVAPSIGTSRSRKIATPTEAPIVSSASGASAGGWVLEDASDGTGSCWTLDLSVPSIESLAEVSLDISQAAVRLTPMQGGPPVAESSVPGDADADGATAKWSKKKRVLTIRMPQQAT